MAGGGFSIAATPGPPALPSGMLCCEGAVPAAGLGMPCSQWESSVWAKVGGFGQRTTKSCCGEGRLRRCSACQPRGATIKDVENWWHVPPAACLPLFALILH